MPYRQHTSFYDDSHAVHSRAIQDLLGRRLRTMYEDTVNDDIPDRLTELLRQLDHTGDEGDR